MSIEFRHLRYFVAVAEEEHITRAAERLGIQQPPLSQQVRALEAALDVQLLYRKSRGVALTEAGRAFFADARAILDQVDRAVARAQHTARGQRGTVLLGFTSSAPFHPFVPDTIRRFRESHPLVSIVLEEGGTTDLVDAVRTERMDAAFIRSPVGDPAGLAIRRLFEEPMLLALPSDHPLANGEAMAAPIALDVLAGEPLVLYRRREGPGLYDTIIAACHRAGFTPRIEQEAPRIVSTLNLVAAGLGATIVPASLRQSQMTGIVYREIADRAGLVAPLTLVARKGERSAAVNRFVELVRREAAAMNGAA